MQNTDPFIQLQTMWILSTDGVPLAQAVRIIEKDTYENKVMVKFSKATSDDHRRAVQEVLSRNINMFGKDPAGGVRWLYFKKGTLEQWVFAAIELERRGYKIKKDKSTQDHTKSFVSLYV